MAGNNVYQMVTDRIIEQLEQGIIPWQRPWHGVIDGAISYTSRRPYSFLNQMLLGEAGEYLTFNQIQALGGKIKKGAKAKMVVFYKMLKVEKKVIKEGSDPTNPEYEKKEHITPMLRYYNVFHLNDTEGIESKMDKTPEKKVNPIEKAEDIINTYVGKETLKFVSKPSNRAYYSPTFDEVVVPLISQFDIAEEYYSTSFHELVHSTGHPRRCNRDECKVVHFGSNDYSKEELCAEIGSAMLLNIVGIDTSKTFKNSIAYLQGWLRALRSDNRFIVSASSKAEKAVKYILGETTE